VKIRRAANKITCNEASTRLALSQKSLGSPAVSTTYVPGAEAIKVTVLSQVIPSVWCDDKRENIIPADSTLCLNKLIHIN